MPSPAMTGPACVPSAALAGRFRGILIENPLHGIDAGHDAETVRAGADIPPGLGGEFSGVEGAGMGGGGWCRLSHGVASLSGSNTPSLALEGRGADLCPGFDTGRDIPGFCRRPSSRLSITMPLPVCIVVRENFDHIKLW